MIAIQNISLVEHADYKELSATVDGSEVWFRFPVWAPIARRAEIFLPLAIAEAMVRGEDVVVDSSTPISKKLAMNLPEIIKIFCTWNADDNRVIGVQASVEDVHASSNQVICCFSGGIDSSFSFSQHQAEITDLLLVMGFDASTYGPEWEHLKTRLLGMAAHFGKRLLTVETNLRQAIESRNLSWEASHGSILACIGITLGVQKLFIPSSNGYNDLFPCGSHPLLDPLWSTEATSVHYDGIGFSRALKTKHIATNPVLLDSVQVCWNHVDHNCGKCSKCLRTALALFLLNSRSASLAAYDGNSSLAALKPSSLVGTVNINDLIQLAIDKGETPIARSLMAYRDQFMLRYHLTEVLRILLGGRGKMILRKFYKKGWHSGRTKIKGGQPTLPHK